MAKLVELKRAELEAVNEKMKEAGLPTSSFVQLAFGEFVNQLSNEERKQLAKEIEAGHLPRNLFYNYETQEWIK